jgi:hypothetical protein
LIEPVQRGKQAVVRKVLGAIPIMSDLQTTAEKVLHVPVEQLVAVLPIACCPEELEKVGIRSPSLFYDS